MGERGSTDSTPESLGSTGEPVSFLQGDCSFGGFISFPGLLLHTELIVIACSSGAL